MKDVIVLGALVLSFAVWATTHLVIAVRLTARAPRWRGPAALVIPPLAPWWAFEEEWKVTAGLWIGAVLVYAGARLAA